MLSSILILTSHNYSAIMGFRKLSLYTLLLILSLLSHSCKSDFDAFILTEPVPVVYGVINPSDSLYQVRLTKSFIGPGNAYDYAQNPDSIYYDNATVYLESRNFKGTTLDRVELIPTEIETRDQGVFSRVPNIVYQTDFNSIRLRPEALSNDGIPYEVELYVLVDIPGQTELTESFTRLKTEPGIINPMGNFQKVYFFGEYPFYMEWRHDDPEVYFEIKVVMRYREILEVGERDAEVYWILKGIQYNQFTFPYGTRTIYTYRFRPENFYSHIRANIPMDPEVKGRAIKNLDFIILTSDGAVRDYNRIDQITDDYRGASFTNVLNGLGLFSSYNTKGVYNQKLGQRELDSLADGVYTKHLNFSKW